MPGYFDSEFGALFREVDSGPREMPYRPFPEDHPIDIDGDYEPADDRRTLTEAAVDKLGETVERWLTPEVDTSEVEATEAAEAAKAEEDAAAEAAEAEEAEKANAEILDAEAAAEEEAEGADEKDKEGEEEIEIVDDVPAAASTFIDPGVAPAPVEAVQPTEAPAQLDEPTPEQEDLFNPEVKRFDDTIEVVAAPAGALATEEVRQALEEPAAAVTDVPAVEPEAVIQPEVAAEPQPEFIPAAAVVPEVVEEPGQAPFEAPASVAAPEGPAETEETRTGYEPAAAATEVPAAGYEPATAEGANPEEVPNEQSGANTEVSVLTNDGVSLDGFVQPRGETMVAVVETVSADGAAVAPTAEAVGEFAAQAVGQGATHLEVTVTSADGLRAVADAVGTEDMTLTTAEGEPIEGGIEEAADRLAGSRETATTSEEGAEQASDGTTTARRPGVRVLARLKGVAANAEPAAEAPAAQQSAPTTSDN